MTEWLLRELARTRFDVFSAGSKPSIVNPFAIHAMRARAIDISSYHSKHLNEFISQPFDYVITVCDNAAETCPIFPGHPQRIHWSFTDPAAAIGSDEDKLSAFRKTRDAIESRLKTWLAELPQNLAMKE
jgi:arsenate reductase (thioredoxin)